MFGKSKHSERSPLKNLTYDSNNINSIDQIGSSLDSQKENIN